MKRLKLASKPDPKSDTVADSETSKKTDMTENLMSRENGHETEVEQNGEKEEEEGEEGKKDAVVEDDMSKVTEELHALLADIKSLVTAPKQ